MNILLVTTKTSGGAARACLMQLDALAQNTENQCHLLTLYGCETDIERRLTGRQSILAPSKSVFAKAKSKCRALVLRWLSSYHDDGVFIVAGDKDISMHPEFIKAEVIIFHWCYNFVNFQRLPRKGKTYYWTCHDMAPFNFGIPYDMHSKQWILRAFRRHQEWKLIRQLKGLQLDFIFPSSWLKALFSSSKLSAAGFSSHLLPNSSDFAEFDLNEKKRSQRGLCFIAADTRNWRKGLDLLIEAIKLVPISCDIHIIGELESLISTQIPEHRVINYGYLSDPKKIAAVLSSVSLFVIPSRQDNLPNTVIESLLLGTPVVGFRVGGIPDMVRNDFNGMLTETVSSQSLAQLIHKSLAREWDHHAIRSNAKLKYRHSSHEAAFSAILSESSKKNQKDANNCSQGDRRIGK